MKLQPSTTPRNFADRVFKRMVREVREVGRRRIQRRVLALPPSPPATNTLPYSIHMLLCRRDLRMGICAAKSFNLASATAFPWSFHDDGSLDADDWKLLADQFPGCRVIIAEDADKRIDALLDRCPNLKELWRRTPLMKKAIDVPEFCDHERLVLVDSDILFFSRPTELLTEAATSGGRNVFNRDIADAYSFSRELVQRQSGIAIPGRLNSGLYTMDRKLCELSWLEEVAARLRQGQPTFEMHYIEQTLTAVAASNSRGGAHFLSPTYDVDFYKDVRTNVCKHYTGHIRYGFEYEGLSYLLEESRFEQRWSEFCRAH